MKTKSGWKVFQDLIKDGVRTLRTLTSWSRLGCLLLQLWIVIIWASRHRTSSVTSTDTLAFLLFTPRRSYDIAKSTGERGANKQIRRLQSIGAVCPKEFIINLKRAASVFILTARLLSFWTLQPFFFGTSAPAKHKLSLQLSFLWWRHEHRKNVSFSSPVVRQRALSWRARTRDAARKENI